MRLYPPIDPGDSILQPGAVPGGELIAELVLRATADMRAIAGYVERTAVSLASGMKAMLAKPVKH